MIDHQILVCAVMQHILVIKLRYIGDVVLTTPLLGLLRQHYPEARVVCLVNPGTEQVLTYNPHIDEVMTASRGGLREQVGLLAELRRRRFDCIMDLTDGDRSAFLTWIASPSVSIGFNVEKRWRGWLYSHCVESGTGNIHMVDHHARALQPLGIEPSVGDPEIYTDERHEQAAKRNLVRLGLHQRRWVMIHPTARYWFKTWPYERFALLSDWLADQRLAVVLVGHGQDYEIAQKIQSKAKASLISLVGQTDLLELTAMMKRSSLFVGNDTGLMHIAAAIGCPVIALFGPTSPAVWGPRGKKTKVIYKGLDCRACFHPGCFRGEESCMKQITAEEVFSASLEMLS